MPVKKTVKKATKTAATNARAAKSTGLDADEKAAMRERLKELKAEASKADGEKMLLSKIAEMPAADRAMATRIHAIVKANAPSLSPKTWYGMPAYAKDGDVLCFFQAAEKFKARYATIGFTDKANLDESAMWATSFALKKLSTADEAKIAALIKRAAR